MRLSLRKSTQSLNKVYAKQSIFQGHIDTFRKALTRLLSRVDENETEDYQKSIVAAFLNETFYPVGESFQLNTPEQAGLLVLQSSSANQEVADNSGVSAVINAKKVFAGEMMTTLKNNVRALHELILYYFGECDRQPNPLISQLIITDVYNWFIFDANDFRRVFFDNAKLKKLYQVKQVQKRDHAFFYSETARILRELDDEVPVTCLNLREVADVLSVSIDEGTRRLIPIYKLFSPEHLLKQPFANDGNKLNHTFYNELLYIIGLDRKVAISNRKANSRSLSADELRDGSLLKHTINQLKQKNALANIETREHYGSTETDQLEAIAFTLCLTWFSRLLFLRLLDVQMARYSQKEQPAFLDANTVKTFGEVHDLFLAVSGIKEAAQSTEHSLKYASLPQVTCELFELTPLERATLTIKDLGEQPTLPLFEQTVLTDGPSERPILNYLLDFLNAYDFVLDGPAQIQPTDKPTISTSTVGLVLESLNNVLNGAYFTPGVLTSYTARQAIHKAVVTLFNARFGWTCTDILTLSDQLADITLEQANQVINSLRIVDPAVGSGHLLASALNELIALKAELGILCDRDGHPLLHYDIRVAHDELIIATKDGDLFSYQALETANRPSNKEVVETDTHVLRPTPISEAQRVQETLFQEKQTLIEQCLFGVDLNPNSIILCRLRLWIELLKSVYVQPNNDQEQVSNESFRLPPFLNLSANIQLGNSLVGRFAINFRLDSLRNQPIREKFLSALQQYQADTRAYKNCYIKTEKEQLLANLSAFKESVTQLALADQKEYAEIRRLEIKLSQSALTFDFINQGNALSTLQAKLAAKKAAFDKKQAVFRQAFEWRFAFPEVLDDGGNYTGFDVVLSCSPHGLTLEGNDKKYLATHYLAFADTSTLMLERSLQLAKPNGQLGFIMPTHWQTDDHYLPVRKLISETAVLQIGIDLPPTLFEKSTVDWGVYLFEKDHQDDYTSSVFVFNPKTEIRGELEPYLQFTTLAASSWRTTPNLSLFFDTAASSIKQRLTLFPKTIGAITTSAEGVLAKKEAVASYPLDDTYRPFFTGPLTRYVTALPNSFIRYESVKGQPKSYGFFTGERVLVHQKTTSSRYITATLADKEFVTKKDVYSFVLTDSTFSAKYVLAILSSRLAAYVLTHPAAKLQRAKINPLSLSTLNSIPVPDASPEQQAALTALVDEILATKRENPQADTSTLEAQLDEIVFDLYGLTSDERAVIVEI
jgi:hypothetical protein